jgi:RNA polymerase sigma-70 factor (ECF subfamily)
MAFSMVEDADDAKDAVSQVFTQMWKGRPNVSEESLSGYLLAATRNQCLHILRQRQLQQQMEEELRQTAEERLRVGASAGMSSNQEREELLCELQQVINDNLTEQDRRVLQLHYEEEMTYQETATVLGISPSAVNKHITRSLAKIRETLKIAK